MDSLKLNDGVSQLRYRIFHQVWLYGPWAKVVFGWWFVVGCFWVVCPKRGGASLGCVAPDEGAFHKVQTQHHQKTALVSARSIVPREGGVKKSNPPMIEDFLARRKPFFVASVSARALGCNRVAVGCCVVCLLWMVDKRELVAMKASGKARRSAEACL